MGMSMPSYLIPDILLEVLLARDVQTNTALAKSLGLDFIACAWDSRDHNIGDR